MEILSNKRNIHKKIRINYNNRPSRNQHFITFNLLDEEKNTGFRFKVNFFDLVKFLNEEAGMYVMPKALFFETGNLLKEIEPFLKKLRDYTLWQRK